jgi:gas vesicle protein
MENNALRNIILVSGAFAAGVITGMLLSPKSGEDNRDWINQNAKKASDWVDRQSREAVSRSEKALQEYSDRLKKEFKDSVSEIQKASEKLK